MAPQKAQRGALLAIDESALVDQIKKREIDISKSCLWSQHSYYYPVWTGWVSRLIPIFQTSSTALYFQIFRYK